MRDKRQEPRNIKMILAVEFEFHSVESIPTPRLWIGNLPPHFRHSHKAFSKMTEESPLGRSTHQLFIKETIIVYNLWAIQHVSCQRGQEVWIYQ